MQNKSTAGVTIGDGHDMDGHDMDGHESVGDGHEMDLLYGDEQMAATQ